MVNEVACIHAGFEDCEFLVRSEDDDELTDIVQGHAERVHDVTVSREHVQKIMRPV